MYEPQISAIQDFGGLPSTYGSTTYTLMGNRYERSPNQLGVYILSQSKVPQGFPLEAWNDQSARYDAYWKWFTGEFLNQAKKGKDGELLYRFPLRINILRDFARKHASVLFGEVADGPDPLVEAKVAARRSLSDDIPSEEETKFARFCENLINEVWMQSHGRAIQLEGGELSQFLGGHYYQITWEPNSIDEKDWLIPIGIRSWKADFVLPIWSTDYWNLEQVYLVKQIDSALAQSEFGIEATPPYVTYVEYWDKYTYSIWLNNVPLERDGVIYKDLENPFRQVPVFYIPHLREGSFYGSSHVPDLAGLIQEYNASMADLSDTISDGNDLTTYIRNSNKRTKVELPNGRDAVDLGMQNPSINQPPDAWREDPISISDGLTKHPDNIHDQIRRSGFVPPVAEGEDEGSQRSGITLDIRFWPITSHTKMERTNWETGLTLIDKFILKIVDIMEYWQELGATNVPDKFMKKISISQKWSPQIPRDRNSLVNELITRLGTPGAISQEKFLEDIGDVENIPEEIKNSREFAEWLFSVQKPQLNQSPNAPLDASTYKRKNDAIDTS